MATKTINLTGAEVAVTGLDGAHAHIRNDGTEVIYAAKTAGITAGADGVASIPAGQSDTIRGISGAIYLLGTGSVLIQSDDYVASPFKTSAQAGGSGADEVARAAINTHSGNAEIHVTAEEKAAWNGKAELTDIPTTLPADGGNADTIDNLHASAFMQFVKDLRSGDLLDFVVLNNVSGFMYFGGSDITNTPFSGAYFFGIILCYGNGKVIFAERIDTGDVFTNCYNGSKWYGWRNVSDNGNAASVGAYTEAKLAALEARVAALENGGN